MKPLFFSHGEKGGVGKSTVASVLVDALVFTGKKRVILIEGDVKIDDVFARYSGHVVKAVKFNLADQSGYQDNISRMLEFVELNQDLADAFVVNLPATATSTIDKDVEMVTNAADGCNLSVRVVYSASPNPSGLSTIEESFKKGLAAQADRALLLAQEFFGDDGLIERLRGISQDIVVFPRLASYTYTAVMEKPDVPLSLLCTKGHPQALETFIQRARLSGWLHRARTTLNPVLDDLIAQPERAQPAQAESDDA